MEKTMVSAPCGQIRGQKKDDCYEFLGIPYATARRFKKPVPVAWEGVRDCLEYGAAPPQPNYRGKKAPDFEYAMIGAEDCLNLNVWTKHPGEAAGRPVVMYVYGGAFQVGGNSAPVAAGDRFIEQEDMVYVCANYRVGVLGFLELGDVYGEEYRGSGNCGIWDMLTAIRWVRDNISCFGGDPDNIMLMGISAGAKTIGALVTLPQVQEVCHKILLESGAMQAFRSRETATSVAREYLSRLPEGLDPLRAPAEKLVEVQAEFCSVAGNTCFFGPVLEEPFALDWKDRWERGERFHGKVMIGSGRHELIGLTQTEGFLTRAEETAYQMFGKNGALAVEKANALCESGADACDSWERVFSDFMYRFYSDETAKKLENEGCEVWMYSFDYTPGVHGQGFYFLQGEIDPPTARLAEDRREEARMISDFFRARVREFIRDGEPDEKLWPRYQAGNKMVFDVSPHVERRSEDTLKGFPDEVFCRE